MSFQAGGFSNFPRLGCKVPAKIFRAVDLPIPFVPTSPRTSPGRGVGSLWSLNELTPYLWVTSFCSSFGRLMILMASKGHLFTHKPQPIHSVSEIKQMTEVGSTSMQTLPALLTGQLFLHSCLHFLGLHLSGLIIAILSFSY